MVAQGSTACQHARAGDYKMDRWLSLPPWKRTPEVNMRSFILISVAAACAAQTPPPLAVPEGIALEANIAYDRYSDTRLDIMYPKAPPSGKRPGVVMFHGGGWIRSTKETMMTAFCLPFLEHGFVVANVESLCQLPPRITLKSTLPSPSSCGGIRPPG